MRKILWIVDTLLDSGEGVPTGAIAILGRLYVYSILCRVDKAWGVDHKELDSTKFLFVVITFVPECTTSLKTMSHYVLRVRHPYSVFGAEDTNCVTALTVCITMHNDSF